MPVLQNKPKWLRRELPRTDSFYRVNDVLRLNKINTVCGSANCPNKWECFSRGTATFLLMGNICTRDCGFCGVEKGKPERIDVKEPSRVAGIIKKMALKHAVITSVTRDDIVDGGAAHFVKTINALRRVSPGTTVEVLTPDFSGEIRSVKKILDARPDIFAHNVEMAPGLYPKIRTGSFYERSLDVLKAAKSCGKGCLIKSGLMVGLGETDREVMEVISDLLRCGVDIITIGQYLQPKNSCVKVAKFVAPNKFKYYYLAAKKLGCKFVYSGPYVRSSYRAEEVFNN